MEANFTGDGAVLSEVGIAIAADVVHVVTPLPGEVDAVGAEVAVELALDGPEGEFAGRLLNQWACLNGVEIDFSRPGKPTDNARIGAFNSRLRAECLNASWFLSIADARERLEAWRREYNEEWPHGSLRNLTPRAFAEQAQQARKVA